MKIHDAALTFRGPSPSAGAQKTIDAVVLHHRAGAGDVQSIHRDHLARGWWGIGYHYYIRRDGGIWRGRPEQWCGSHAGASNGYNSHSLGICFEGNFEREHPTGAQLAAGRELICDLRARHPIREVLLHRQIAATVCPGRYFPAAEALTKTAAAHSGSAGENGDWWSDAVRWAAEQGILRGDGEGDLRLDEPLTRKEGVVLLWRAMGQNV